MNIFGAPPLGTQTSNQSVNSLDTNRPNRIIFKQYITTIVSLNAKFNNTKKQFLIS